MREPWRESADTVADGLRTDLDGGLTTAAAAARLERTGANVLAAAATVPAWRKVVAQLRNPLIYLLFAAALVSLIAWIVGGRTSLPWDAIVVTAIVVANAVLGYVQEARAEHAVAALQQMAAPTATVLRDRDLRRIPSAEIVPGDVLVLAEGDAVAADGRLAEAAALMVAEAALTGESEPVLKRVAPIQGDVGLGDRANMVFSGTTILRGRARAVVTATGMSTQVGRIAGLLDLAEPPETPLQREVDRVGRMLGVAVLAITVVVVAAILLTSHIDSASAFVAVLLVGVSLAVAAVPEGLPAVLSVVLALGVQRMARRRAIVKKLASVETLGSATVVCSDKTGTLTRNEMTIQKIVSASGEVDVTGTGYRPEGALVIDDRPLVDAALLDECRAVLLAGSLANDAVLRDRGGSWTVEGDPTEAAFLVAEAKIEGLADARSARFERIGEVPFTSERRLMTTVQADRTGDLGVAVVTKGAPDVLLARCAAERVRGADRPLRDGRREEILADVARLAGLGLRPLAVAYRALAPTTSVAHDESVERDLVFLGMVGIMDPPRAEARAAIADAHAAGVRVVMITGDHAGTAARIAADLGIAPAGSSVMTGAELEALAADDLVAAVRQANVYARVTPEQKLRIVDALHADAAIVAMTGDGVNDAPALKAADIGVAMGIAGTDVARQAADMILADDNFATIVGAIREGRGIFANIRTFLRFLLSSNIGEVLTVFLGVVLAGTLGLEDTGEAIATPLLATQILWINLLTDAAPALALGVDPPRDDVMSRPPRRPTDRVIDARMWVGIGWVGLVMALVTLLALDLRLPGGIVGDGGNVVEARSMAVTTLVVAQLFNCFNARSDRTSAFRGLFANPLLWGAIALSALLQVAVVEVAFLNEPFGMTPLDAREWLICVVLASMVLWANEAKKLGERLLRRSAP